MPLRVSLDLKRSPYWRIRGAVCGESVDRSSRLTKRAEAEALADRLAAEIQNRHIAGQTKSQTAALRFATAVRNYLLEPGRGTAFDDDLERLVLRWGTWPIERIDQASLDAYVRERHAGQSPESVLRHTITPLTAVLRHAGLAPRFRRPKRGKGRVRYLTPEEAHRLIDAAAPHLQPLFIFLLHTGARLGEALALDWSQVDLPTRRVIFLETKNGDSRGIPLNDDAFEALANLSYRTGIRDSDGQWQRRAHRFGRVFRTQLGRAYPLLENAGGQIKRGWAGACKRARVAGATPHTLRHTFASWLVQRGVSLPIVGELLGHRDPSMVKRYAHLSPDHLAGAVDLLRGQKSGDATAKSQNRK
jgi:integrase